MLDYTSPHTEISQQELKHVAPHLAAIATSLVIFCYKRTLLEASDRKTTKPSTWAEVAENEACDRLSW